MTHFLRLNAQQFASTEPFILTKFEDPYQKGDKLILQETEQEGPIGGASAPARTGQERTVTITRVARNEAGLFKGWCLLVWEEEKD